LGALLAAPAPAAAAPEAWNAHCQVPNAAGPAAGLPPVSAPAVSAESARATHKKHGRKHRSKKHRQNQKTTAPKPVKLSLTADPTSANKVVNLGTDREPEEVTLRVNAAPRVPKGFGRRLEVVAEPFVSASETGDTNSFEEPRFSHLRVSGNRKRITFEMCVDAPNDTPAGKYVSTVQVEGPPSVEAAVMTVTVNGKDGGGFWLATGIAAFLAFCVLLYKGAGEKRALAIVRAQTKPAGEQRDEAVKTAERWLCALKRCVFDLGWWVPSIAALASAFALLLAAYTANPAWGEGGLVTNVVALTGTGLAAIGAKSVFTPTVPTS
jgi:hypothetical protein